MEPLIASLLRPEAYDHPVQELQLLQTHLSWILLTGSIAYKIKKPVDLGFVDFSSAERRRFFCQEELRLNQRLAPELYLGLSPVHGPIERASFYGSGAVIETAVRMRQFRQQDLLRVVLRRRDGPDLGPAIEALAEELRVLMLPRDPNDGRAVIMEIERRLGFEPTDREFEQLGYDIESRVPGTGKLRFIEVKGRVTGADTVTVTKNEILYSLNKPDHFVLALVEFLDEQTHRVRYLRRPFDGSGITTDFNGASVNFPFEDLLQRAQDPS